MKIAAVVGTCPQLIKAAPILDELGRKSSELELAVLHSGQHHDFEMSRLILDDLGIREPTKTFVLHGSTHGTQTAEMLVKLERFLASQRPRLVIVFGDTNTTLAAALAGSKLNLPVAHVEAGARSFDSTMPEEVNRRLVDHCSSLLFTPTETTFRNLAKEGITKPKAFMTGDAMVDALLRMLPRLEREQKNLTQELELDPYAYGILTLHRPGNVDSPEVLQQILQAVANLSWSLRFLFPIHPRTMRSLSQFRLRSIFRRNPNFIPTKPLGYASFLAVLREASVVLTDSGGVQKEAFLVRTPCVTLRDTTEWPETLESGCNVLAGSNPRLIEKHALRVLSEGAVSRPREIRRRSPFGDGKASVRIAQLTVDSILGKGHS